MHILYVKAEILDIHGFCLSATKKGFPPQLCELLRDLLMLIAYINDLLFLASFSECKNSKNR